MTLYGEVLPLCLTIVYLAVATQHVDYVLIHSTSFPVWNGHPIHGLACYIGA